MNIVSSLKSIPVTHAYRCIITAWSAEETTEFDRKPFRVFLPCGAEGFAVGDPEQLCELMDAQCEGQWVEEIGYRIEEGYWQGMAVIADDVKLGVRIEGVYEYISHRLDRRQMRQDAKAFEESL